MFVLAHMHLYLMTGYIEDMYTGKMFKAENFSFFIILFLLLLMYTIMICFAAEDRRCRCGIITKAAKQG